MIDIEAHETLENFRIYPTRFSDATALEARRTELRPLVLAVLSRLSPEDRNIMEEYLLLLQEKETFSQLAAYASGLQIGERRAKRREDI